MNAKSIRRRMARRLVVPLAAAGCAALVLGGCAGQSSSTATGSGSSGATLTLGANDPPPSLNPILQNVDPWDNWFINLAYDPLIRATGTGALVPDLATKWGYTDSDNTSFQLTLRQGVKFSDGEPLTAQAVAASLSYAIKDGVNGPNWLSSVSSVTAPSADTVLIKTKVPNGSLPFLLSQRLLMGSIIAPKGVSNPNLLKTETMGVGPYTLDQSQTIANSKYVFVPNKAYWDQSDIHYKQVVIQVVSSATSALESLKNGQLDIFTGDSQTGQAAMNDKLGVATTPFGLFGVNYDDRNGTQVKALGSVQVREALSYAINRPQISQAVFGNFGTADSDLTVPGFAGYSAADANAFPYNPAKAKQLLAQAGYPKGFSFNMASTTDANANVMAQAVVQDWAAIGVKANLTTYSDDNQLISAILAHKYPVTIYAYGALPQFIQAASYFNGGQTQYNPYNTSDAQLSADLENAAAAPTPAQQNTDYAAALNRAIVQLVWMSNVVSTSVPIIYNNKAVAGVTISGSVPTPDVAWSVHPAG